MLWSLPCREEPDTDDARPFRARPAVVSRLYDRIRAQCTRPVTAADLHAHSGEQAELRAQFAEDVRARGLEPTPEVLDGEVRKALAHAAQAKALTHPLPARLDALPSMPVVNSNPNSHKKWTNNRGPVRTMATGSQRRRAVLH